MTLLLLFLHWLPVSTRIRCLCTLIFAYKAQNGSAPSYLKALMTPFTVPCFFGSSSTAHLVPPSLKVQERHVSRLISVLAPKWWNELPLDVRIAKSLGDLPLLYVLDQHNQISFLYLKKNA